MNPTLVVLAAGIGRRYGGLKQMDPISPAGEFLIDYSVYDAVRAGFGRAVFVIRRQIEEAFQATIGARISAHIPTGYVFQELDQLPRGCSAPAGRDKPWGTGHAVLACAEEVHEPFAVINADDFYGRRSYEDVAAFLRSTASEPARYAMVGFVLRNTLSDHGSVARGICAVDAGGTLKSVVEQTKIEKDGDAIRCGKRRFKGDELVSMNIWGFKPSVFGFLREEFERFLGTAGADPGAEFFVPDVVNTLIRTGKISVSVLATSARWFGVTYPQDKAEVVSRIHDLIAAGEYPPALWA
jgi:NDP-sugar pyrophosphorylase family protein